MSSARTQRRSSASSTVDDDSADLQYFFNLDQYQAISPEAFDDDVQQTTSHGGGFVDLLCTCVVAA